LKIDGAILALYEKGVHLTDHW